MKRFRLWLKECWIIACYCIGKMLVMFNQKPHWILVERGDDARDNGYFLYKYIKDNHPEQKVYYYIDRKAPDYFKVKDDAVQPGSLKSYFLLASAGKLVSTHYASALPIMSSKLFKLLGLHRKFYFLQHGIIKPMTMSLWWKRAWTTS